ncbi:serine protease [Longispora fulva]|uniref:Membrane-bound serine protease (ClpP class) n=1 Tax=Longispora fulva TaxID=619741 RepID=A0A8J7GU50_9ACTN|nr:nodulation protein NfeD [Longispora fulva]MBG6138494.1 membrane-bound serine protease (ClpP class) [Longispora fulva]GIG62400.1 serine protease [Longispora fulva]
MPRRRWLVPLVVLVLCWVGWAYPAAADTGAVLRTRITGPITPVVADHLADGVREAEHGGYRAYLVELDTPGGLDTSMRSIIQSFLAAQVPVIVYVSPAGARAASAGALITFSAHIAAMAPGTTIGASTPVDLQGGKISDKVINDAAAFARTVATQRGRNVEFAEQTVREGRAVTADEALKLGAVDLVAGDRGELLSTLDGRSVVLADGRTVVLRTRGVPVVDRGLGALRSVLQLLADPNLAFLFLSLGTLALLYELASPGHLVSGIVGVIMLVLGFVALSVLPINTGGVILVLVGLALLVAELYAPGTAVFALTGAGCLLAGGLLLFQGPFRLSLAVLLPTVLVVAAGAVVAGRLTWAARHRPVLTGPSLLVGREVTVRRTDDGRGRVMLEGAWWNARRRDGELRVGQRVRVVAMENLDLVVEPAEEAPDE